MAQIVRNGGIKPFVRRSSGSKVEVRKPKGVSVGDNILGGEREEDDKKRGSQVGEVSFPEDGGTWLMVASCSLVSRTFSCAQSSCLCVQPVCWLGLWGLA